MLSRRALAQAAMRTRGTFSAQQAIRASFSTARILRQTGNPEIDDPDMNGGYINPPAIKRQFRDPYGDWSMKQERRNVGEPVHEDEDILGIFSLEEYTHMTPAMGLAMWAFFLTCLGGMVFTISQVYPDRPSAPKAYEGGLDRELGGPGSLRAFQDGDEVAGVKLERY